MEFVHCGTLNQLFTLYGMLGSWERAQPVNMGFVDLEKTYSSLDCGALECPMVNVILNCGNEHLKSFCYMLPLLCSHQAFSCAWQQLGGSCSCCSIVEVESFCKAMKLA